jgi:hypothetical protein
MKGHPMVPRLTMAMLSAFILASCDDNSKDTSQNEGVSVCKELDETQCTANSECFWRADKAKCTKKESDETSPQQDAVPPGTTTPESDPDKPTDTPQ